MQMLNFHLLVLTAVTYVCSGTRASLSAVDLFKCAK